MVEICGTLAVNFLPLATVLMVIIRVCAVLVKVQMLILMSAPMKRLLFRFEGSHCSACGAYAA